jgi:hypothetical protein
VRFSSYHLELLLETTATTAAAVDDDGGMDVKHVNGIAALTSIHNIRSAEDPK